MTFIATREYDDHVDFEIEGLWDIPHARTDTLHIIHVDKEGMIIDEFDENRTYVSVPIEQVTEFHAMIKRLMKME